MLRIKGLIAPVFTPMGPNGSLELERIAEYAQFLAKGKVSNIFIGGTSSEFSTCTISERKAINKEWLRHGREHLSGHMIVQVGASALRDAQELAKHAVQSGAHAIACVSPFYQVPTTVETMVDFFKALTEVVPDTPFIYYHIPTLTHCAIDLTDFLRAALEEIPTLVGLKYTDSDLKLMAAIHEEFGDRLQIFNGHDEFSLDAMKMGIEEGIQGLFNFMPGPYLRMKAALAAGDMAAAEAEQALVTQVVHIVYQNSGMGLISAIKDVAAAAGLDMGPSRLPLRSIGKKKREAIHAELQAIGVFERQF